MVLGLALGAAQCTPTPEVQTPFGRVAGVAWFDDGDGVVEPSEPAAAGLVVQLGVGLQRLASAPDYQAPDFHTNGDGEFVLPLPDVAGRDLGELDPFVEVTLPSTGPTGRDINVHFRQSFVPGNESLQIALPLIQPCTADIERAIAQDTVCGKARLPDLVPLVQDFGQPPSQPIASASSWVDTETQPHAALLRFSSATANLGSGPLHMIPDRNDSGDQIFTWQRIWTDNHQFVDHRTGEFLFHETHDHFHLAGFEQYRLLTTDGDPVATGEKISFCLTDNAAAVPDPQTRGFGIFVDVACQQANEQQSINPGWADYYGSSLPDQWIDITGVDPGDYLVEIMVDPDNVLIESDETNNRATFQITLTSDELNPD